MAASASMFYGIRLALIDCKKSLVDHWLGAGTAKTDWTYLYVLPSPEVYAHMWSDDDLFAALPDVPDAAARKKMRDRAYRVRLRPGDEMVGGWWLTCDR